MGYFSWEKCLKWYSDVFVLCVVVCCWVKYIEKVFEVVYVVGMFVVSVVLLCMLFCGVNVNGSDVIGECCCFFLFCCVLLCVCCDEVVNVCVWVSGMFVELSVDEDDEEVDVMVMFMLDWLEVFLNKVFTSSVNVYDIE